MHETFSKFVTNQSLLSFF